MKIAPSRLPETGGKASQTRAPGAAFPLRRPRINPYGISLGRLFQTRLYHLHRKSGNIRISMDGKGAWRDNVFVERLWRSAKYEEIYLFTYKTGFAAQGNRATSRALVQMSEWHTAQLHDELLKSG